MVVKYYKIIVDGYDELGGVFYAPSNLPYPITRDGEDVGNWHPPIIELKDGIYRHFNLCNGSYMLSEEFKNILCSYIPMDYPVEFLPVLISSVDYGNRIFYVLHFTKIFDVIDKQNTIYIEGTDIVLKVRLDYEKVKNLHLFNSQPVNDVIVSAKLRNRLKKEGLDKGVEFVPIYCTNVG